MFCFNELYRSISEVSFLKLASQVKCFSKTMAFMKLIKKIWSIHKCKVYLSYSKVFNTKRQIDLFK